MELTVAAHPLLELGAFVARFARPLAQLATPHEIVQLVEPAAVAPLVSSDTVRTEVRNLLRHGGFRPSGRSKPAAEYLHAAHQEGRFPRINAAVDACNVASLWSGLPISLVDADKLQHPLTVRVLPMGTSYVFNPSGQVIDAGGLLALCDAEGPTGTPVKDAQRTKTDDATTHALAIVWGTRALPGRTQKATAWYRELVQTIAGAMIEDVRVVAQPTS
ncbi:MAG TPA: phenylalanine--tRNA ligase beta subunit-related protein [Kofleriaceae bacterium]|nr:phenylalanine--tRNA ligase beta subunit-related protein [Kofleriaceae bacterium]